MNRKKMNREDYQRLVCIKRFFEYAQGYDEFTAVLDSPPMVARLLKRHGLVIPTAVTAQLIDYYINKISSDCIGKDRQGEDEKKVTSWLKAWLRWECILQENVDEIRYSSTLAHVCPEYDDWRNIQVNRSFSELGNKASALIHGVAAFELSDGCSGQCPYCGLAAGKLEDVFQYTKENRTLWRKVLTSLRDRFGDFSANSVCYWATDPYDNPDIIKFITDFKDILGMLPQTTTSLPTGDTDWLKRLLNAYEGSLVTCRVSVNTPELLKKLHRRFTPEELLRVQLLINYTDRFPIVRSGKMLARKPTGTADLVDGTIACITGYVVNMCRKNVKLVSPCIASKQWPYGYIVHHDAHFNTAEEFADILDDTIANHMVADFREKDRVSFRSDLSVNTIENDLILESRYRKHRFSGDNMLALVGKMLENRSLPFGELMFRLIDTGGEYLSIVKNISQFRRAGLFSEQAEHPQGDLL